MYDLIIVGGGPAGLTSAIYSLRAKKKVLLIEKMIPGGQVAITSNIENYPGFDSISGMDLSTKMFMQANKHGLETVFSEVIEYDIKGNIKKVKTNDGIFEAKAIILSLGASARQLDVKDENKYIGHGVSYCATCDGNFFKNKNVAIVGGGNTSIEDCLYLYDIAKEIYLIHRRDSFRSEKTTLEKVKTLANAPNPKIHILTNSVVKELKGNNNLDSIVVENKITKQTSELKIDGVFVAIGRKPDTELLRDVIELDENGYIITDENMSTNIKGVYAAGDVRKKSLRQIVTACSDGAIASFSVNSYLATLS